MKQNVIMRKLAFLIIFLKVVIITCQTPPYTDEYTDFGTTDFGTTKDAATNPAGLTDTVTTIPDKATSIDYTSVSYFDTSEDATTNIAPSITNATTTSTSTTSRTSTTTLTTSKNNVYLTTDIYDYETKGVTEYTTEEPVFTSQTDVPTNGTYLDAKLNIEFMGFDMTCSLEINFNGTESIDSLNISWYIRGQADSIYTSQIALNTDKNKFSSILPPTEWVKYINNEVYCQLDIQNDANDVFQSSTYYLGLVVYFGDNEKPIYLSNIINANIKFTEGTLEGTNFTVRATFPLICKSNENCDIKVYIDMQDNNLLQISSDSDCYLTITNNKASARPWSIYPVLNLENRIQNSQKFNISFKIVIGTGLNSDFLKNLQLPTLKIEYVPLNRPYINNGGSCYNDPHCYTNDGRAFEFQYFDGEYLMYENKELQYRVHLISEPCATWPSCGCNYCIRNIFIQSFDDFVSFDAKRTPSLSYIDLSSPKKERIPIVWNKNNEAQLPKSTAFKIIQSSYQYTIISHFGTGLVIDKYGSSFQMVPSKLDKNKVFGLLGNYNGDSRDDFTTTSSGTVNNMENYFKSYNVIGKNLPQFSKGQFYNVEKQNKQFCTCQKGTNNDFEKVCKNGLVSNKRDEKSNRRKRDTTENDNDELEINVSSLAYILDYDISGLINQKPPETSETSSCESVLRNNQMLKKCNEFEIIDLNKLIEDCEIDFNVTQLDIWADYYLNSRKGWCKNVLEDDVTYYNNDTQINVIIEQLCLNDCSNHGTCKQGICSCNENYAGDDCSIDLKAPPKLKSTLFENNMCDLSKFDCQFVSLFSTGISPTDDIKVLYNLKNTVALSKRSTDVTTVSTVEIISARSITENIIVTNLPRRKSNSSRSLSVKSYSLKVTNTDEQSASNSIDYTIFDSKCHTRSNNQFVLKPNTCDIDDLCYLDGETKPDDKRLYCNSRKDTFAWSNSIKLGFNKGLSLLSIIIIFIFF